MFVKRTILAISVGAAVVFAAAPTANAASTVAYVTVAQICTTKDAQKPNINPQRPNPNPNWWMGTAQSQMTMRPSHGQTPNDVQNAMQTFPTVYQQPVDKNSGAKVALPTSTCSS